MSKKYFLPVEYFDGTYFNSLGNKIELPNGVQQALSDGAAKLEQFNCFTPENSNNFLVSVQISLLIPASYGLEEYRDSEKGYTVDSEFKGYNSVTLYSLSNELLDYFRLLGTSFVFQYDSTKSGELVYFKNGSTNMETYLPVSEILSFF